MPAVRKRQTLRSAPAPAAVAAEEANCLRKVNKTEHRLPNEGQAVVFIGILQ